MINLSSFKDLLLVAISTCAVSMYLGGTIFYFLLVMIALFFVLKYVNWRHETNRGAILVLVIAFVSTLVNYIDTPPIFQVERRTIMLFLIIVIFSPAITNGILYAFRKKLFYLFVIGLSIVGISSALLSFVGFGYIGPYLRGLSDFPNSLGYTLGITMIFSFSILIRTNKWFNKLACLIIILLCYRTIPLTGTRTAFYSIPIFLLAYLFFSSKNTKELVKKTLFYIGGVILVLLIVQVDMSIINKKNALQKASGKNSRTELFYARQKEFEQSPIIGIGTFRGDPQYAIINKNGNVEVGNTFLSFLSMNGIVGFINFIVFYLSLAIPFFMYVFKRKKEGITSFEMLLLLVVIYNFISMQQMGLALNPGLYSTGFNWLVFGLMYKPHIYLSTFRDDQQ